MAEGRREATGREEEGRGMLGKVYHVSYHVHMLHPRDLSHLSIEDVFLALKTRISGRRPDEIEKERRNIIMPKKEAGMVRRFFRQFKSPLIYILVAIAFASPLIGEWTDAIIISAVLLLNALIGAYQEGKASEALQTLNQAFVQQTTVRRDGQIKRIPAEDICVGDIVILQAGDQIPADGRFIQTNGLRVDESSLTGESVPVTKTHEAIQSTKTTPLGDIRNAAFRQTLVVSGQGEMVVSEVGEGTEIGRIAKLLAQSQTEPPLVKKIRELSTGIAIIVAAFSGILVVYGIGTGQDTAIVIGTVASLAVSVIPEGLPIVLTLVLARGVSRMAKKNAIVKRPQAVEGLGNVDVICTDKTGTLTQNQLSVSYAYTQGALHETTKELDKKSTHHLQQLAYACRALGQGSYYTQNGKRILNGDPIDAALGQFGEDLGIKEVIQEEQSIPFSFQEKTRRIRINSQGQGGQDILSGAPEAIHALAPMDADTQQAWKNLAKQGQRIIAIASRKAEKDLASNANWAYIGFVSLSDRLREGVPESIAWCHGQGIHVAMITGDHPDTAQAIALSAGLPATAERILTGAQLEELDDLSLARKILNIVVFARITPEHKVRIVNAFQAHGKTTAMTGDGVNDAPALQAANIGVAMGKGGTDVAREAADIVLTDDHFATIVTAIQEGRAIVGNVRKVLTYLFSTSIGEALIIAIALFGQWPIPLLPVQILWLNFVTDGFLVLALAMEQTHYSQQHHHDGRLVDHSSAIRICILGSIMAAGSLAIFSYARHSLSTTETQTYILLIMAMFQWVNVWSTRSESKSIFQLSRHPNPYLLLSTIAVVLLQIIATYVPWMQELLHTTSIPWDYWLIAVFISLSVVVGDEAWKNWRRLEMKAVSANV